MDIFENALSDGADADAKLEAELASDTDAVVSVIYPEQAKIGRMLSTAEGAPSPLFRGVQLVTVAVAVGGGAIVPDGLAAVVPTANPRFLLLRPETSPQFRQQCCNQAQCSRIACRHAHSWKSICDRKFARHCRFLICLHAWETILFASREAQDATRNAQCQFAWLIHLSHARFASVDLEVNLQFPNKIQNQGQRVMHLTHLLF